MFDTDPNDPTKLALYAWGEKILDDFSESELRAEPDWTEPTVLTWVVRGMQLTNTLARIHGLVPRIKIGGRDYDYSEFEEADSEVKTAFAKQTFKKGVSWAEAAKRERNQAQIADAEKAEKEKLKAEAKAAEMQAIEKEASEFAKEIADKTSEKELEYLKEDLVKEQTKSDETKEIQLIEAKIRIIKERLIGLEQRSKNTVNIWTGVTLLIGIAGLIVGFFSMG